MKRLSWLVVACVIGSASVAWAQAPNVVSYKEEVWAQGVDPNVGSPLFTNVYAVASVLCNQAPVVPPVTVVNPTRWQIDDVANAGRACIASLISTLLPALPPGTGYFSTLIATDNLGLSSPRSAASNPFAKQGPPAAPTGHRLLP